MTTIRRAVFLVTIASLALAGLLATAAAAQEATAPPNRAYAFGNDKIAVIDEDALESLGTIPLPEGRTEFWWNNAERDRLALVITDGMFGNQPATLVVIDLETDKIVNTVQLGFDARRFMTSDDGNRAFVILNGKIWRGTRSIVAIDTKTGTIVARAEIKREPTDFFLTESGEGLIFVDDGLNALKANQRKPASLELFDAATLESRKKSVLPGPIQGIYLDFPGRMYLLNPGVDDSKKKNRAQGEIYIVDRETLDLKATLEVGMAPGQLAWDPDRELFYLLTSPWATRKQAEAQLHLIGAEEIVASIELPRRPLGAQPSQDREYFYVLYEDDVVRVDRNLEQSKKVLSLKDSPVQLFEHPDNGRFYALHYDSPYVSVVNGATGKTDDKIKSGRNTKRVAKLAATAGANVAMAGLVVATGPSFTVDDRAYYYVPVVNPYGYGSESQTTFATFSEAADFLFVYNAWTDDVTVIDTKTNQVVEKLAGGEDGFMTVADGKFLCAISSGSVRFFDAESGFAKTGDYDGYDPEVVEIPGKNKAFFSQDLGKPVAVIDLENWGELVEIPGTFGKVIRLTGDE